MCFANYVLALKDSLTKKATKNSNINNHLKLKQSIEQEVNVKLYGYHKNWNTKSHQIFANIAQVFIDFTTTLWFTFPCKIVFITSKVLQYYVRKRISTRQKQRISI